MTGTLLGHPDDFAPLVYVLVAGVLATAVWRLAAVVLGGRIAADHPLFEWARTVAVAIVAAQAAILVAEPSGPIAGVPGTLRAGAVLAGFAVYHFGGRSVLLGVAVGEAAILAALAVAA